MRNAESLYRPSNGSEGAAFMDANCRHCERDRAFREDRSPVGCELIVRAMVYGTDDSRYPKEWTYREDGRPTCTALRLISREEK